MAGVALVVGGAAAGFADLIRAGVFALVLVLAATLVTLVRPQALRVDRTSDDARMRSGGTHSVRLTVTAPRGTWAAARVVEHQTFTDRHDPHWSFDRLPSGPTRLSYETRPPHRGTYLAGPITLALSDPLGLVHTDSRHGDTRSWLVWPRLVELSGRGARRLGIGDDEFVSPHAHLSGLAGASVREYTQGDDIRRVHWPATAHRGELMVRQFDPPAQPMTRIVLSGSVAEPGTDDPWELLVSLTASACVHLSERGIPVTVGLGDHDVDSVTEALDELAAITDSSPAEHAHRPAPTLLFHHTSVTATPPPPQHLVARALVAGPGAEEAARHLDAAGWTATVLTADEDPAETLSRELETLAGGAS